MATLARVARSQFAALPEPARWIAAWGGVIAAMALATLVLMELLASALGLGS